MKIMYEERGRKEVARNPRNIPIGTVFSGRIIDNSVYLRTVSSVVDLRCPLNGWTVPSSPNGGIIVFDYRELNAKLTVSEIEKNEMDKKPFAIHSEEERWK